MSPAMRTSKVGALVALLCLTALASDSVVVPAEGFPAASAKDVESIETIMVAVYDVISGPAGEERDWSRLRSLFLPEARLIRTELNPQGETRYRAMTVEEYIERSGPVLVKNGFFEKEISRREEVYEVVAHVWSTYESRHLASDEEPFSRGINSFQLMKKDGRWWVMTILWETETPNAPIPEKYVSPAE